MKKHKLSNLIKKIIKEQMSKDIKPLDINVPQLPPLTQPEKKSPKEPPKEPSKINTTDTPLSPTDGDIPLRKGCMDDGNQPWSVHPGYPACNYDIMATVNCLTPPNPDNTSPNIDLSCCEYEKCTGCMQPAASNYDPNATIPGDCSDVAGSPEKAPSAELEGPTMCVEWTGACNYGEEGECHFDCPEVTTDILGKFTAFYWNGPCVVEGNMSILGTCCVSNDPDAGCGEHPGDNDCIIDELGGSIANYMQQSDIISGVCDASGWLLGSSQAMQQIIHDIEQYILLADYGFDAVNIINAFANPEESGILGGNTTIDVPGVGPVSIGTDVINNTIDMVQNNTNETIENWANTVSDVGDMFDISQLEIDGFGIIDIVEICNAGNSGAIIEFIANAAGVSNVAYEVFYNVICAMDWGINQGGFGPGAQEYGDEVAACCSSPMWTYLCGAADMDIIEFASYNSTTSGIYADWTTAEGAIGFLPNDIFNMGVLIGGQYTWMGYGINTPGTATGPFGGPGNWGYCVGGDQPTWLAGMINENKKFKGKKVLRERFQKLAGIKSRK